MLTSVMLLLHNPGIPILLYSSLNFELLLLTKNVLLLLHHILDQEVSLSSPHPVNLDSHISWVFALKIVTDFGIDETVYLMAVVVF